MAELFLPDGLVVSTTIVVRAGAGTAWSYASRRVISSPTGSPTRCTLTSDLTSTFIGPWAASCACCAMGACGEAPGPPEPRTLRRPIIAANGTGDVFLLRMMTPPGADDSRNYPFCTVRRTGRQSSSAAHKACFQFFRGFFHGFGQKLGRFVNTVATRVEGPRF